MKNVLVTTAHRGVFFGQLEGDPGNTLTLKNCRNCLYWSQSSRGFIGLATDGPNDDCRVGPAADEVTLFDVTSVVAVSDDAAKKWESAPWG